VSFAPTDENIYNGDYPLRLPFYIVYKPANLGAGAGAAAGVVERGFSAHFAEQHFTPMPETARKRSLLGLTIRSSVAGWPVRQGRSPPGHQAGGSDASVAQLVEHTCSL